jgi:hypothetical protein
MRREVLGAVMAILVAISLGGGYLYGLDSRPGATTTELSTTTVPTPAGANEAIASSFANHILFLSARNSTAIASQYAENATVTWAGVQGAGGFEGIYNRTEIPVLMNESFIGGETSFTISNVNRFISVASGDSAEVYSTFAISGQGDFLVAIPGLEWSAFNATVSAHDSYVYSAPNSTSMISNETWIFTSFNTQCIC